MEESEGKDYAFQENFFTRELTKGGKETSELLIPKADPSIKCKKTLTSRTAVFKGRWVGVGSPGVFKSLPASLQGHSYFHNNIQTLSAFFILSETFQKLQGIPQKGECRSRYEIPNDSKSIKQCHCSHQIFCVLKYSLLKKFF